MVGQLKYSVGGRGKPEWGRLYGLPVLRTRTDPGGWLGDHRLRRAGRTLRRGGVLRTLVPADFDRWPVWERYGLLPVDPSPLVRSQGGPLALEALRRQGIRPERATVALRGLRADRDMTLAAACLCTQVRHLVVTAPRGGWELALWLRREFGVPVLPQNEEAQVALRFAPDSFVREELALELYGLHPDLAGLNLTVPDLEEEDRSDLPLLTALWEGGRLDKRDLKIT